MKSIAVLGSTGSIGTQTLDIVDRFPDKLQVKLLSASKLSDKLLAQIQKYKPEYVYLPKKEDIKGVNLLYGEDGLKEMADLCIDLFVNGIAGINGIKPTYLLLKAGKRLATANKEAVICLGEVVGDRYNGIIPIDSEHSAIFQGLKAGDKKEVKRIILTASGGPFWNRENLDGVSVEEALNHPKWKMGKKVSIDSATMMNKGLEIIEAHYLFGIPYDRIEAVIHPQSYVHGVVEFVDGSMIAHISPTDMRIPIGYALSYPDRWEIYQKTANLWEYGKLEFYQPDEERFPLLKLAKQCGEMGGAYPTVLTVADEMAVEMFLKGRIGFNDIYKVVKGVVEAVDFPPPKTFEDIMEIIKGTKAVFNKVVSVF
ncbi:MAG: 1-deoxy-D-xylulose-5-phosphate reductoisomerase [Aquificae bacterium]|nr:1-deoxy-D-xylulose-5-phosphate reductoisomerase [Aquificota bacterium]